MKDYHEKAIPFRSEDVRRTKNSPSSSLALLFSSRFSFESAFDPPRNPIDLPFLPDFFFLLFFPFHLFSLPLSIHCIHNDYRFAGKSGCTGTSRRAKEKWTDLRGRSERGRVSGGRIERRVFLRSKTSMRRKQENTSRPPRVVVAFSVKLLR